jgi:hypothetical protein
MINRIAGFDGREIRYVTHPIVPVDFSSPSEFVYMGHELSHANDYVAGSVHLDREGHPVGSINSTESNAVTFENYLRTVYRIPVLRKFYHGVAINSVTTRKNKERVKNFTQLDQRDDGRAFGFTYVSYYKDRNGSESQRYMIAGIDEKDAFYYQYYETEEDYQRAISEW